MKPPSAKLERKADKLLRASERHLATAKRVTLHLRARARELERR